LVGVRLCIGSQLALCHHYGKYGEVVDLAAAVPHYEKIASISEAAAYHLGTIYESANSRPNPQCALALMLLCSFRPMRTFLARAWLLLHQHLSTQTAPRV
jgi:TPR repeat protein